MSETRPHPYTSDALAAFLPARPSDRRGPAFSGDATRVPGLPGAAALLVLVTATASPLSAQDDGGEISFALDTDAERPAIPHTTTERITTRHHPDREVLEVVVGPVELEDGMLHLRLPVQMMTFDFDGWLRGYSWEITDAEGNRLPDELLHHVNVVDPDHRKLFDPTARRILAAGRETLDTMLPSVMGIPFQEGTRYMISAMFANSTGRDYPEAYLRVHLHYVKEGDRLIRPHDVYPFYLDVMGPVGVKDFPVPPGRTVRGWEGSPAVDAYILGAGGHLHDYATEIRLIDLTTGEVLWSTPPYASSWGRVHSVPQGHFWWNGGIRIHSDHRYRVEVVYENPTDEPAPLGGMGVVAGIAMPVRGAQWPAFDRTDPAYLEDLRNHVTAPMRLTGHGHGHHGGGEGGHHGGGDHGHGPH